MFKTKKTAIADNTNAAKIGNIARSTAVPLMMKPNDPPMAGPATKPRLYESDIFPSLDVSCSFV